jgi:hypothetical protein
MVWFLAEPGAMLAGLKGGQLPPVGAPAYPVLFAPGLPDLFRLASSEEAAVWEEMPRIGGLAPLDQLIAEGALEYISDALDPAVPGLR